MSDDQDTSTDKPTPESPDAETQEPTTGAVVEERPGSWLRSWGAAIGAGAGGLTRAMAAALVAVLLVGLAGGYAVSAVVGGEDDPGRPGDQFQELLPDDVERDGQRPGPGGQLPPGMPEDAPAPDSEGSGDTTSGSRT